MSAEDEIRRLMGRYVQAHDTHDVDTIVGLFASDGLFANDSGDYHGHTRIREFFERSRARATPDRKGKLMCANTVITLTGEDTAEALTDVAGLGQVGDEPWTIRLVAQYADTFVRQDDAWRYQVKRVLT
jgi:uncharacterized protein (TIGR02246 family)